MRPLRCGAFFQDAHARAERTCDRLRCYATLGYYPTPSLGQGRLWRNRTFAEVRRAQATRATQGSVRLHRRAVAISKKETVECDGQSPVRPAGLGRLLW